jgi:hypothetical protein
MPACVEDLNFHHPRGLDRTLMLNLAEAQWVQAHNNILISGATGAGKTSIACALAHAALRRGHTALYVRAPRMLDELSAVVPAQLAVVWSLLLRGGPRGTYAVPLTDRPGGVGLNRGTELVRMRISLCSASRVSDRCRLSAPLAVDQSHDAARVLIPELLGKEFLREVLKCHRPQESLDGG